MLPMDPASSARKSNLLVEVKNKGLIPMNPEQLI